MILVFWQNIISPHQSELINALAQHKEVEALLLVVAEQLNASRLKDGWKVPALHPQITLIQNPDAQTIDDLTTKYVDGRCIHIFSGITAYPLVKQGLMKLQKGGCMVGVMSEPSNWMGWRGVLNRAKGLAERIRFGHKIDFLLTIGHISRWWFAEMLRYDPKRIFEFAYFSKPARPEAIMTTERIKLVYVGRLIPVKGVDKLIVAYQQLQQSGIELHIIGEGPEQEQLQQLAAAGSKTNPVIFHGKVPITHVYSLLDDKDVLILPSIGKDGWGAVVNEALLNGLRVVVSNYCGSAEVANVHSNYSYSFDYNIEDDLRRKLNLIIQNVANDPDRIHTKQQIVDWANAHLTGPYGADYLINVIYYLKDKRGKERPKLAWLSSIS